uniref:PRA1 family protein n=1 Tax=Panagrellus redivivus TaxID=6233 RepID=A0A7E4V8P3_PANRE
MNESDSILGNPRPTVDVEDDLPVPPRDADPPVEPSAELNQTWNFNVLFTDLLNTFAEWRAQFDVNPPARRYGFSSLERWRIYGTLVLFFNMIPLFFLGMYMIFVCCTTIISAIFIQGSLIVLGAFISFPFFVAMSVVGLSVGVVIVVIGHFCETNTLKKYTPGFLND